MKNLNKKTQLEVRRQTIISLRVYLHYGFLTKLRGNQNE